ncbi:MAG: MerR family transcriptional regulator, partial [Planctomycetota bacterium]
DILGLPKLHVGRTSNVPGGTHPEQMAFREALVQGDEESCRKALSRQINLGFTRYEAAEFLITDAMKGLGLAWVQRDIDAYQERRGCDICIRLINELRSDLTPPHDDAPVAIGGAPGGDMYQLPTALVELTLREIGWKATSLGANLPADSFVQACYDYQPALVWMSVSHVENVPIFVAEQNRVASSIGEDTPLILGGRAVNDDVRPRLRYTAFCDSMKQLAELSSMMRMRIR